MLIATFIHHHSSERPTWKEKVQDHAEALIRALEDEYGREVTREEAEAAIVLAKANGEATIGTGDEAVVVWWEKDNFGCGDAGSVADSCKYLRLCDQEYSNVWIQVEDQVPEEGQREKYEAMSKEALVELLLERDILA